MVSCLCELSTLLIFFDVRFFVHIQGVALGPLIEAPIKMDPLREKAQLKTSTNVCKVQRKL